jgi:uncharacterized lipoprotein YddW (UPF0748 family)
MNTTIATVICVCCGMILASCVGATERVPFLTFDFPADGSVEAAWTPSPNAPLAEAASSGDRSAIRFRCNLTAQAERCYWDTTVSLNLIRFGRLTLEVFADNADAIRNGSLYFRSGDGWYGASFPVLGGPQTVRLSRGDFRPEGSPTGWNAIDGVRFGFWKGSNKDAVVDLRSATAISDDVLIVRDRVNAEPYAGQLGRLLARVGLDFGAVDGADVESGALTNARLAFFPYNPNMTERDVGEVLAFIGRGGKAFFFYDLPDRVAPVIGVAGTRWVRPRYDGEFAKIRFSGSVAGLPPSIGQGSWNARIPEVRDAVVLGEWVDANGKATGLPAMTLHPNGVFMGHVLLTNDLDNKRKTLFALVGHLLPERRRELAASLAKQSSSLSGFDGFDALAAFVTESASRIPESRRNAAMERLNTARQLREQANRADSDGRYEDVVAAAEPMNDALREAFYRSLPSRDDEFRGVWCHSAFGIPGWTWDEAIKNLAVNGFTAVLPNMLWGGLAYYASRTLPEAPEVATKGDQIAACLAAAKKYGVQVHVWKVNWNLTTAPKSFVNALREQRRLQRNRYGAEIPWLCPSNPENFRLERDSMLEVVRNYPVDGIHFDYIRYSDSTVCFCDGCRKRFEVAARTRIREWPQEVLKGKLASRFADWRRDQITRLVRSVSENARKIRPEIKISAAVFHDYPTCRESVGQDWKAWVDAGYLDFVCPMDYTSNAMQFGNWVSNQVALVAGKTPLFPGIGSSAPGLLPEETALQVHTARQFGAPGFVLFNYDAEVAREHLSALRKGATAPVESSTAVEPPVTSNAPAPAASSDGNAP